VSALEQKNLALETVRKLLNDQIKISEQTILCKPRSVAKKAMLGYTNKQISTAETIAKSLGLADRHPSESAPIYAWEPSDPATEPTLVFL
jgi:hypothetical protein